MLNGKKPDYSGDRMAEVLGDESTDLRRKRFWQRQIALSIPVAILFALWVKWWISWPFNTLQRFGNFVEAKQFDDAILMIATEDRKKIPAGYWEHLERGQPEVGASPTPFTLINGQMAVFITLLEPDSDSYMGTWGHFVIDRDVVHVHEIRF